MARASGHLFSKNSCNFDNFFDNLKFFEISNCQKKFYKNLARASGHIFSKNSCKMAKKHDLKNKNSKNFNFAICQ